MRISLSARAAKVVGFEDLGMEATYKFEVRDMPVTVVMDSSGTSVNQLLLVTNVTAMKPAEVVARDKSLADIERGFRVLKSEIEIAPVYLRLPERIRAHAGICFMALILHRVMRQRLKLAGHEASPATALEQLRRIQPHSVRINDSAPIGCVSTIHPDQAALLAALRIKKPPADTQMMLL